MRRAWWALSLMAEGATNIVMNGVQLPKLMENIEKYGVTNLFLPPTAIYVMLAHPDVRKYDYSSLDYFVYAAAPCRWTSCVRQLTCSARSWPSAARRKRQ